MLWFVRLFLLLSLASLARLRSQTDGFYIGYYDDDQCSIESAYFWVSDHECYSMDSSGSRFISYSAYHTMGGEFVAIEVRWDCGAGCDPESCKMTSIDKNSMGTCFPSTTATAKLPYNLTIFAYSVLQKKSSQDFFRVLYPEKGLGCSLSNFGDVELLQAECLREWLPPSWGSTKRYCEEHEKSVVVVEATWANNADCYDKPTFVKELPMECGEWVDGGWARLACSVQQVWNITS